MIYGHGNNICAYKQKVKVDYSSNVFNHPKTDKIIEHIKQHLDSIKNYPDCDSNVFRNKIANTYGLSKDNILLCNGSTEAFYLLAHTFKQRTSLIPTPSFSEYEDACSLYNHKIEFIENNKTIHNSNLIGKTLWLGNPNNPDGKYIEKSDVLKTIIVAKQTLFIIDEAYIDLCKGAESLIYQVGNIPNLILVRSFTKLYAIPGIRLGYIIASADIIQKIRNYHMPWAVNSLAIKAGEYILDKLIDAKEDTKDILISSKKLQEELQSVSQINIIPSTCNYFLANIKGAKAQKLKDYLMQKHGFLIRNAANFRGLSDSWFRIASQGVLLDTELVLAVKKWLQLEQP